MNSHIKPVAHAKQPPLSIEREFAMQGREMIIIEGVRYDADYFRTFGYPETDCLYAVQRRDEAVMLTVIRTVEEARDFFDEIILGLDLPAAFDPRNDNDMEVEDGL